MTGDLPVSAGADQESVTALEVTAVMVGVTNAYVWAPATSMPDLKVVSTGRGGNFDKSPDVFLTPHV